MQLLNLQSLLENNPYPGRGILLGMTPDGKNATIAYFIMGRSENSRNRVFTEKDGGIITEAHDPAKLVDPSLIIYAPVRVQSDEVTVVTNGDQTDTVVDFLNAGKTFEAALQTRTFEPDPPNFTPRISGVLTVKDGKASYQLSILKSNNGDESSPLRFFFKYDVPKAGQGHFIHTYVTDGNPIPSFEGEPEVVGIDGDIDTFTNNVWQWLNEDNKVSLFTRYIDLENGNVQTRIINKLN
ncbi:MAG: inosine monophosphate cyclohydrolase [Clostridiales bacterium]|nr:inosine monophosphate cyclohydrolase [Clostridiales bacterium]